MNLRPSLIVLSVLMLALSAPALNAGPHPPAAGQIGSDAIPADDPAILAWTEEFTEYLPGESVSENFATPGNALGPAKGDISGVVSLGRGGRITLIFEIPIADGPGPDLAVFENSFSDGFLELAFVEVSSNGTDFVRFPGESLTADPVGSFGAVVDPTDLDNLAGKYRAGFGTPFDLADLADIAGGVDLQAITHVRIVDIVGDGVTLDRSDNPIFDPFPTSISAGFDLDAVGALNLQPPLPPELTGFGLAGGFFVLEFTGSRGAAYRVERSFGLREWAPVEATITDEAGDGRFRASVAVKAGAERAFYRVTGLSGDS